MYSPYSETMPEESDAVYAAYCGLRRAHSEAEAQEATLGPRSVLYGSCEERESEEGGTWLSKGLGMMLEVISV